MHPPPPASPSGPPDQSQFWRSSRFIATSGVHRQVVPSAGPVLRPSEHPFLDEPGLFERTLLGHVFNIGRCLNPVDSCRGKEMYREQLLRLSAKTMSPCLRNQ